MKEMKPITKEIFIEAMTFLYEQDCGMTQLNKVFKSEFEDSCFYPYLKWENMLCKLLKELTNDEGDWISYFCWELDFGAKYEVGSIRDKDGTLIHLRNVEDLYNLLISQN